MSVVLRPRSLHELFSQLYNIIQNIPAELIKSSYVNMGGSVIGILEQIIIESNCALTYSSGSLNAINEWQSMINKYESLFDFNEYEKVLLPKKYTLIYGKLNKMNADLMRILVKQVSPATQITVGKHVIQCIKTIYPADLHIWPTYSLYVNADIQLREICSAEMYDLFEYGVIEFITRAEEYIRFVNKLRDMFPDAATKSIEHVAEPTETASAEPIKSILPTRREMGEYLLESRYDVLNDVYLLTGTTKNDGLCQLTMYSDATTHELLGSEDLSDDMLMECTVIRNILGDLDKIMPPLLMIVDTASDEMPVELQLSPIAEESDTETVATAAATEDNNIGIVYDT